MSKPKQKLADEAIQAAVTKGQPRTLPQTITLTRSQVLSLNALNNDEQKLRKQATDVQTALEATIQARVDVLNEIGAANKVTLEEIGNNYRFDGEKLLR